MEKSKRKNGELNAKRYWQIFGILAIILLVMVRYPVRVWLSQTLDDMLIFGILSLGCLYTAIHIYRRSKWQFRRLIAVILLCAVLSAWQVSILKNGNVTNVIFAGYGNPNIGFAWYITPLTNGYDICIYEKYFGNEQIAVAFERQQVEFNCRSGLPRNIQIPVYAVDS
jgi:hypothetical protein